jgi:hypothetical protein
MSSVGFGLPGDHGHLFFPEIGKTLVNAETFPDGFGESDIPDAACSIDRQIDTGCIRKKLWLAEGAAPRLATSIGTLGNILCIYLYSA